MINTTITVHVHPDDLEEIARDLRRQTEEATLGQEVPWRTLARKDGVTIRASVDQDAWHRRKREKVDCAHPADVILDYLETRGFSYTPTDERMIRGLVEAAP